MASIRHQFIMDCIIRKMRLNGFEPICVDGKSTLVSTLRIPPKIIRHRPDIMGVNKQNKICVGEAKTESDVASSRTKEQIVDYNEVGVQTFLGCPKSAYERFSCIIQGLVPHNLEKNCLIKIPDELMPNEEI